MCYDIKVSLERQLKVAKHYGDVKVIEELEKKLLPLLNPIERELYQVSGFEHPKMFILEKSGINIAKWGLIPHWIQDLKAAHEIQNKTLNARVETLLEKPSFKDASIEHRGVLFVDGFYEHQHRNGKTYPYFIREKNGEQTPIATVSSVWKNPLSNEEERSFSIVTTQANPLMKDIHNNPKLSEARMPLILSESSINDWLNMPLMEDEKTELDRLVKQNSNPELVSHTVKRFSKKRDGHSDEHAAAEFYYPELGPTLFD